LLVCAFRFGFLGPQKKNPLFYVCILHFYAPAEDITFLGLCDMVAWGRESLLKNFSQKKNTSLRTVQKKTIKTWIVSAKKNVPKITNC